MANARVDDQHLKDAFAEGVAEVWDEYLVGVVDGDSATTVVGVSEAIRVANGLLPTLEKGQRVFIEKRGPRRVTTHDHAVHEDPAEPDVIEGEVVSVERD